MIKRQVDIAILGSGFGGSLAALLVERIGLSAILLDRGSHPRFAIGESSTPIADAVLRQLARKYRLPRLEPLTTYGSWQATYPQLVCGLKRGFSYFQHDANKPFQVDPDHSNELLVEASNSDSQADTHWLRADVDGFLVSEVQEAGIPYVDRSELTVRPTDSGWRITGQRLGEEVAIEARFVIDATGEATVVPKALGIRVHADGLHTHARTLFAHVTGLGSWHDYLAERGGRVSDHPFCCDDAALHQVIEEGWMWQLRFNNGVTSVGFVLDSEAHPLDPSMPVDKEWSQLLHRYPSLADQFHKTAIVHPPEGLRRTPRFQRWADQMAGTSWALLPYTAGFIDPLHSTGIAHTLCGIERLVSILQQYWERPGLDEQLQQYGTSLRREIALIDKLVSGCYQTRRHFSMYNAFVMLYFATVTTYERRRYEAGSSFDSNFLCAEDRDLCATVDDIWHESRSLLQQNRVSSASIATFVRQVTQAIEPYNRVGLFKPAVPNMYHHTAPPKS